MCAPSFFPAASCNSSFAAVKLRNIRETPPTTTKCMHTQNLTWKTINDALFRPIWQKENGNELYTVEQVSTFTISSSLYRAACKQRIFRRKAEKEEESAKCANITKYTNLIEVVVSFLSAGKLTLEIFKYCNGVIQRLNQWVYSTEMVGKKREE